MAWDGLYFRCGLDHLAVGGSGVDRMGVAGMDFLGALCGYGWGPDAKASYDRWAFVLEWRCLVLANSEW
jgi:hypothetical protein